MYGRKFKAAAALLLIAVSAWAQGPNNTGNYYQNADGKKGRNLKTALFHIISANVHPLEYGGLYDAYKKTDVREDGKIWDMYSGITNYVPGADENHGGGGHEGVNYNREHSFPKSWFGGKIKPMYTDLFHIYPTDSWVNSKRWHLPFGEVDTKKKYEGSKNMFSKWGPSKINIKGYSGDVFEPNDEYKGDFARTYFYMATRYEDKIAKWGNNVQGGAPMLNHDSYNAYTPWAIEMLMRWAKEDPVSQKEIDRNNAVDKEQNNRNPFIDYPGLEQYIWGNMIEVPFSYDAFKDPTGIENVEIKAEDSDVMYDINGCRVDNDYKGIVIKNGKKVLVN